MVFCQVFLTTVRIPVSPIASKLPSLAQMQRESTKDGNITTLPFHASSRVKDTILYADNPDLK